MRSFYDRFPRREDGTILCPADGRIPLWLRPVPVDWVPRARSRSGRFRPIDFAQVERQNGSIEEQTDEPFVRYSHRREPDVTEELDGQLRFGQEEDPPEPYEFDDFHWFGTQSDAGIRSMMQPALQATDYGWRAPAARCRSCGIVTWVASINDGTRMLRDARHRKSCKVPPSRLEIELRCDT